MVLLELPVHVPKKIRLHHLFSSPTKIGQPLEKNHSPLARKSDFHKNHLHKNRSSTKFAALYGNQTLIRIGLGQGKIIRSAFQKLPRMGNSVLKPTHQAWRMFLIKIAKFGRKSDLDHEKSALEEIRQARRVQICS